MNKPIEHQAQGKMNTIYATRDGDKEHDFGMDEGEGRTGWKQINATTRRKVVRVRISHTACAWREIDEDPPADHKKYLLF